MTHYRMHRGWMDNPAFGGDREPLCRRAAWCWLIENANWKATKVDAGGRTITVERGQLCVSYRYLSKAWGWSLGKVQLFIDRLKTDTMINTAANTGRMVITICNYDRYQAGADQPNTPDNTVANTPSIRGQYESKEGKKEKKNPNGKDSWGSVEGGVGETRAPDPRQIDIEDYPGVKGEQPRPPEARPDNVVPLNPPAAPRPKPYALPADWEPPAEWLAAAAAMGHPAPQLAAVRFRNHWRRKVTGRNPYAAKTEADWRGEFEAWIAQDVMEGSDHGQRDGRRQRGQSGEASRDVWANLARREIESGPGGSNRTGLA